MVKNLTFQIEGRSAFKILQVQIEGHSHFNFFNLIFLFCEEK